MQDARSIRWDRVGAALGAGSVTWWAAGFVVAGARPVWPAATASLLALACAWFPGAVGARALALVTAVLGLTLSSAQLAILLGLARALAMSSHM